MPRSLAGFSPLRCRGTDCLGPSSRPSGRRRDRGRSPLDSVLLLLKSVTGTGEASSSHACQRRVPTVWIDPVQEKWPHSPWQTKSSMYSLRAAVCRHRRKPSHEHCSHSITWVALPNVLLHAPGTPVSPSSRMFPPLTPWRRRPSWVGDASDVTAGGPRYRSV